MSFLYFSLKGNLSDILYQTSAAIIVSHITHKTLLVSTDNIDQDIQPVLKYIKQCLKMNCQNNFNENSITGDDISLFIPKVKKNLELTGEFKNRNYFKYYKSTLIYHYDLETERYYTNSKYVYINSNFYNKRGYIELIDNSVNDAEINDVQIIIDSKDYDKIKTDLQKIYSGNEKINIVENLDYKKLCIMAKCGKGGYYTGEELGWWGSFLNWNESIEIKESEDLKVCDNNNESIEIKESEDLKVCDNNNESIEIKESEDLKEDLKVYDNNKLYINENLINRINYMSFNDSFLNFYLDKMELYINILKKQYPYVIFNDIPIKKLCFDTWENCEQYFDDFNEISNLINNTNKNDLFIFDELAFPELLSYSLISEENNNKIIDFLKRTNYIVFFSEVFENTEKLNTIGNCKYNKNFTIHFFKYAKKVYLCNVNNINILRKHNIKNNLLYFPPIGFSELYNTNLDVLVKDIDVLFYGNGINVLEFRKKTLLSIKEELYKHQKTVIIKDSLHGLEKNNLLSKTKIVIHVPMFEHQTSFPWAKCCELILKRVFFMIYNNVESINTNQYKMFEIPMYDLTFKKIIYYLSSETERERIINYNYDIFLYHYNLDTLLKSIDINKNIIVYKTLDYKELFDDAVYITDKDLLYSEFIKNYTPCLINDRTNIKISIIMAYKNRIDLLFLTLIQLNKSCVKNFEVIIVDDNSRKNIDWLEQFGFKFYIKIITLNNNNDLICPGNNYNIAFNESIGDIIVIQNPECLHFGDIPNYVIQNFKYDDYLSFPCYSSNNIHLNDYIVKHYDEINICNIEHVCNDKNKDAVYGEFIKWYQHPTLNNRNLHFCTVISREYLEILGCFSSDYNDGFCFEDDDFIFNIKNKLKLNIKSIEVSENVGVVHLYHGRSKLVNISKNELTVEKKALYEQYSLNENILNYKKNSSTNFNIPKIFHYYWDDFKKFSYLNLYSLKTSLYYHPDYIHIIWCPINANSNITWNEDCNKDYNSDSDYNNYLCEILKMKNVRIIYKDIQKIIDIPEVVNWSEIHKSDLFRYYLLNRYGGVWSDLDIVYIKSITILNIEYDTLNFYCNSKGVYYIPIGLMISKRGSKLFELIFNKSLNYYNPHIYECIGSKMMYNVCNPYIEKIDNNMWKISNLLCEGNNLLMSEEVYMSYNWNYINELFISNPQKAISENTIGYHWFNGSDITQNYLKNMLNYTVPSNYQGLIFKEKQKFNKRYNKCIFLINNSTSHHGTFYIKKQTYYINILNKNCLISTINIGNYVSPEFNEIYYFDNELYVFDELSYYNFLYKYDKGDDYVRQQIRDFLLNSNYIIFYSELFESENLNSIGGSIINKEYATLFFKNAQKVVICNTKNRNMLLLNNIYENVVYFPPLSYSIINNIVPFTDINLEKNNDVFIYGNGLSLFDYRNTIITTVKNYCNTYNYTIKIEENIHDQEKNDNLKNTKIVIHVPSHPNLHTFPWAKVSELMARKIFFIIEENEEMYIQKLDKIVAFYKSGDNYDLLKKIEYYLQNENERNNIVDKCYTYIETRYDMDLFIKSLILKK
jgi:hypothetical protein